MQEYKSQEKTQNKKKRRQRQIRRRILALAVLLLLLAAGIFAYWKFAPTSKRMEPKAYFETMLRRAMEQAGMDIRGGAAETEVSAYPSADGTDTLLGDGQLAVMLQDHVSPYRARLHDGAVYLHYDMVRENISTRFFLDEERSVMLLTTADDNLEIPFNSRTFTSADDGSEFTYDREIILTEGADGHDGGSAVGSGLYLDAAFLGTQANVDVQTFEDGYHALVGYNWGERTACEVKKDAKVRFGPTVKHLVLTSAVKGDPVYLLDQQEKWSRVVTTDGYIGYLPNNCLGEPYQAAFEHAFDPPEYTSLLMDGKVNLVWHQIGLPESNDYLEQDTAQMTGVNVISPTWFFLSDNEGNFTSYASSEYVEKAHGMGLQVWGLVSNFSPDMDTSVLVSSTAARRNLAKNLVDAALEVKMDGINVDLEAITESAGSGYVQFVRELSVLCRKNGLVLSVDVPEPFDFNEYYDRKELGTVADYVILMGYDEHYVGSEAGSVASLSFEEEGIIRTLESVPAEKIIAGVPFYTRLWFEGTDGSVWSEVISINPVYRTLESYGVTPVWNEETQQNYAEWVLEDGITCRIWIEDEASLALKAGLVNIYDLGGIAEWALGNERASVWEVISHAIAGEAQTETEQTQTAQTEAVQAETAQTEAAQAQTAQTEAAQAQTAQTEAAQAQTAQTETAQAQTAQAQTAQAQTAQTEAATEPG